MNDVLYSLSAAVTGERPLGRDRRPLQQARLLNPLARRRDELRGLHANTHIPQVIGAARRYELSGDARFRDVAEFFWRDRRLRPHLLHRRLQQRRSLAHRTPAARRSNGAACADHQECCCAYNMMKLTRMLYSWSGDPRYIDYYERNLFNHRLGAIQHVHRPLHLLPLPDPRRLEDPQHRRPDLLVLHRLRRSKSTPSSATPSTPTAPTVSPSISSSPPTLDAAVLGVGLRQDTKFPQRRANHPHHHRLPHRALDPPASHSRLDSIAPHRPERAATRRRARPFQLFLVHRAWKPGDRVTLQFPMRLTVEPMPDDPFHPVLPLWPARARGRPRHGRAHRRSHPPPPGPRRRQGSAHSPHPARLRPRPRILAPAWPRSPLFPHRRRQPAPHPPPHPSALGPLRHLLACRLSRVDERRVIGSRPCHDTGKDIQTLIFACDMIGCSRRRPASLRANIRTGARDPGRLHHPPQQRRLGPQWQAVPRTLTER